MELDNYTKSVAENCYQVYQDMTGQKVLGINIDRLEPPFALANFKVAIAIPCENKAENGLDGFARTQASQPGLIIMDLIMPKMGGLEAVAGIREAHPSVPIIILTSTSKKEEVVAAAVHKVKGYVKKPIQMDRPLQLALSCFQ